MKLIFFRHAEAQKKHHLDTELEDFQRKLIKTGVSHARAMVNSCAPPFKGNKCIFTSSYPRAVQTAAILHRKFPKTPFEMTTTLDKFNDPHDVLKLIRTLKDGTYTFVGHEPQFSELIGLLVSGETIPLVKIPKAGILVLEGPIRKLKIQTVISPKLVSAS